MQASMYISVILFFTVSLICVIVLAIYIIKLTKSATKLTDNANIIAESIKKEGQELEDKN